MYLTNELKDEYNKWRQEIEQQILGSKDELKQQLASVDNIDSLPYDIRDYVQQYSQAVVKGDVASFINKEAAKAFETATDCKCVFISPGLTQSPSRVVVRYAHHTPLQWAK